MFFVIVKLNCAFDLLYFSSVELSVGNFFDLWGWFQVQFAAGRDLRPGQLGNMIQTLSDW